MALRLQWQKVNQILGTQQTPIARPHGRNMGGVSVGRILEKTDRVIAAPHCICWLARISYWGAQNTRLSAPIEISLNNTNLLILSRALQLCKYPMMQIGQVDLIWQPPGTRFTENNMLKVSIAR